MKLTAYISDMIHIKYPKDCVDHPLFAALKEHNTHSNPKYELLARLRKRRFGVPKKIKFWKIEDEDEEHLRFSIPRGTQEQLDQLATFYKVDIEWVDNTVCPELPIEIADPWNRLDRFQRLALNKLLDHEYGCLEAPTGSGKTNILLSLIYYLQTPTLILVHTRELLKQTRERCEEWTGVQAGILGDGQVDLRPITVAMVQTLSRLEIDYVAEMFGAVIVDECFVANTLIDDKPIEQIRVGDLINSFNPISNRMNQCKVLRCFKQPVKDLVKITIGSKEIVCTSNHPFLTKSGEWTSAIRLTGKEVLVHEELGDKMQLVRNMVYSTYKNSQGLLSDFWKSLLHKKMWSLCLTKKQFGNHVQNKSKVCLRKDEKKESHVFTSMPRKGEPHSEKNELATKSARRKREVLTSSTGFISCCIRLANRVVGSNRTRLFPWKWGRVGIRLQNRCGRTVSQNSYRSRWPWPQQSQNKETGPEKRTLSCWKRVDHVKILQPASDGEFERMCPDGYVYNLEVEGNHTYLANQVVVHNCHHSPCATWGTILNQIPARYKYGFTATAWRKDRLEFLIWKVVGPIRWKVTRQEAVQAGRIMLPKIEQVETEFYFPLLDPSKWGEMITCLTEDSDRNELLEQTVRKRLTEAGRALILTDRVAHAEHLADRLRNLHPALLVGTMDNLKRKIAMERVKNGAQLTIATTHLLGEGVDVPGWDMLFLVSPFAAGPRVLQALGRIVRTSKGKSTATLIDFVDYRIPMLARAAHGRQSLYDDKERRR